MSLGKGKAINVVFVVFDDVTQLDFTGPAQCLARMLGAQVILAAAGAAPIRTDSGFSIVPSVTYANCPQADVLCVPGGRGVSTAIRQKATVNFVRSQASHSQWVTAVCTGAFILGAAGLLRGKRATTHWGYTHLLPVVGAVHEPQRVVTDGTVITAGGVTSGIDFGLTLVSEVAGRQAAQTIQLALEYNPAPPFDSGTPDAAPAELVAQLRSRVYEAAASELKDALLAP
jgi:cyclohexyl-isocyanide hydratase